MRYFWGKNNSNDKLHELQEQAIDLEAQVNSLRLTVGVLEKTVDTLHKTCSIINDRIEDTVENVVKRHMDDLDLSSLISDEDLSDIIHDSVNELLKDVRLRIP